MFIFQHFDEEAGEPHVQTQYCDCRNLFTLIENGFQHMEELQIEGNATTPLEPLQEDIIMEEQIAGNVV